jgi:fused signal recognition particle receptor
MDILFLFLIGLVVISVVVGVTITRRRGREDAEIEPQPAPGRRSDHPSVARGPRPGEAEAPAAPEAPKAPERVPTPEEAESVDEALVAEIEEALAPPKPPSFRDRLGKARGLISGYVSSVLSRSVDADTWGELEEALIRADVGVEVTSELIEHLRKACVDDDVTDPHEVLARLKGELKDRLQRSDRELRLGEGTSVWLFVGVNGVGKTTTIGKVGRRLAGEGKSVMMAAGDTFRAAAAEQLEQWSQRVGADLVRGSEGGDPGSVVFDAVQRAAARELDVVLADTAGRLHTKSNLMDELRKVRRVADKPPGHVSEVLLVIDATTGQNGLVQAQQFTDAVDVTGVVLTKLDGTAKGGIVLAIEQHLGIPVKLVGLGETADDLVDFDADDFVEALFEVGA